MLNEIGFAIHVYLLSACYMNFYVNIPYKFRGNNIRKWISISCREEISISSSSPSAVATSTPQDIQGAPLRRDVRLLGNLLGEVITR